MAVSTLSACLSLGRCKHRLQVPRRCLVPRKDPFRYGSSRTVTVSVQESGAQISLLSLCQSQPLPRTLSSQLSNPPVDSLYLHSLRDFQQFVSKTYGGEITTSPYLTITFSHTHCILSHCIRRLASTLIMQCELHGTCLFNANIM